MKNEKDFFHIDLLVGGNDSEKFVQYSDDDHQIPS